AAADNGNVLLAYGGHIGRALDWGTGNSAGGISGSPYHMNLEGLCSGIIALPTPCNDGGSQDRALAAATVVIPTGSLTIVKQTVGGNGTFNYTSTGVGVGTGTPAFPASFSLTTPASASITSTGVAVGDTTVTEGTLPTGWSFTSVGCTGTVNPTIVGQ